MRTAIGFLVYNSRPIALAAFCGFLLVLALRGMGLPVPFGAALGTVAVALAAYWYATLAQAWENRPELRWDPPRMPKLRYTARQKWGLTLLAVPCMAGGFLPMAVPAIPMMAVMGAGFFVLIVALTLVQRRLNSQRLESESQEPESQESESQEPGQQEPERGPAEAGE